MTRNASPLRPPRCITASPTGISLITVAIVVGMSASVFACTAPKDAFCVDYFAGRTLSAPVLATATESTIKHAWLSGSPDPAVPADNFSGRWSGRFDFDAKPVIFRVVADDGVRLKLDGETLIDGWRDQAATAYQREWTPGLGEHLVEVEYYDGFGQARLDAYWEPVRTCDLPVGQFCAEYYDNRNLQGNPRLKIYEPDVTHEWGGNGPAADVPADNFSARWKGEFDFDPGAYRFTAQADDGVRVWLDEQVLIDAWTGSASTPLEWLRWLTGRHRVMVEYFDAYGAASVKTAWSAQATTTDQPVAAIGSNANSLIGTNFSEWRDWSVEQPFLDVFKTSRPWIPQAPGVWDTGEAAALDLDADGWVRSLPDAGSPRRYRTVSTLMLNGSDLNGIRQGGEYLVLYEGEGRIDYGQGARKNTAASRPGRDVINVDSQNSGGIQLTIAVTDPNRTGNYIRNIRVVASGRVCDDELLTLCVAEGDPACGRAACRSTEAAAVDRLFHPAFLRSLVHYKVLRFMNPLATNVINASLPQIVDWSQRATLNTARWSGQAGIPIEAAVSLSNQLRADPWLNVPHRASDDYVRQYARLVKASLAPERRVYLEYANEIWNTAFSAGTWVEQQGLATWPDRPDSAYTKRMNWYGKRSAEICDLWKAEWGGQAERITCVVGAQAANTGTANMALDCPLWQEAPCQRHGLGAVAIAPYFGHYLGQPGYEAAINAWLADPESALRVLFEELEYGGMLPGAPKGGALAQTRQWIAAYADLARRRNLKLMAYEGGQHLVGIGNVVNNAGITNLFVAANRDPRMGSLYLQLLESWRSAGGDLFVHFVNTGQYGRFGSWGARENLNQLHTPKADALRSMVAE